MASRASKHEHSAVHPLAAALLLMCHAWVCLSVCFCCCDQGGELWVHLSHPWCDCSVAAGDKANIMGGTRTLDADGRQHAYLDHSNGTFVLHPDVLLSGGFVFEGGRGNKRAAPGTHCAAAGSSSSRASTITAWRLHMHSCAIRSFIAKSLCCWRTDHMDGRGVCVSHPCNNAGTAITTALTCVRRAWLSERFAAAGGGPGAAATRGTLLHELLQRLLVEVVGTDGTAGTELPGVQQLEQMVSARLSGVSCLCCSLHMQKPQPCRTH